MNDKIILAQNIKGTGKATFEGLYDIDDDPVTVVVDKNDDGVYIVIYKDIGKRKRNRNYHIKGNIGITVYYSRQHNAYNYHHN